MTDETRALEALRDYAQTVGRLEYLKYREAILSSCRKQGEALHAVVENNELADRREKERADGLLLEIEGS